MRRSQGDQSRRSGVRSRQNEDVIVGETLYSVGIEDGDDEEKKWQEAFYSHQQSQE